MHRHDGLVSKLKLNLASGQIAATVKQCENSTRHTVPWFWHRQRLTQTATGAQAKSKPLGAVKGP